VQPLHQSQLHQLPPLSELSQRRFQLPQLAEIPHLPSWKWSHLQSPFVPHRKGREQILYAYLYLYQSKHSNNSSHYSQTLSTDISMFNADALELQDEIER